MIVGTTSPLTYLISRHVPQSLQCHLLLFEPGECLLESVVGELSQRMVKHPLPVVYTLAQGEQLGRERRLTFTKSYLK